MKRLATVTIVAALIGTPAFAADMAVKAPPPPPAPVYNWTGFYLGGTLGYSVGHDPATDIFSGSPTIDTATVAPAGPVGGFEAGYNWQIDHWLIGIEGDWQWMGQHDSWCLDCFPTIGRGIGQKLPWSATVRGRLGYAVGPVLFYTTGGAAFGKVETTINCCFNGTSATFDDQKSGWVFGAGIEAALVDNWSAKIEYLYLDLGNTTHTLGGFLTGTSEVRDHIFRAGLNYRFGAAQYQAAYVPNVLPVKAPISAHLYNWTGFYAGGNFGYSVGRDPTLQSFAGVPNDQFTFAPNGWLVGGQVGYNWQISSLVLGLEGDAQWSGQKDTGLCRDCPPTAGFGYQLIEQKLPWFATARGRIGYAAGPSLFYVTGGVAFTELRTAYSDAALPATFSTTISNYKTGAAVGAGIEAALFGNWTAKAEYLYLDFGAATVSITGATEGPLTLSSQLRDNILRAGLNYKFGAM